MKSKQPMFMIMDACVLIDFLKTNRSILELIVKSIGPVHVTSPVVDEVKDINDAKELTDLGLIIIEPETEDAFEAAERIGSTSFQDNLCLLTARRFGFTCVTNDKNLRTLCTQEKIPLMWGLELLAILHKRKGVSHRLAESVAREIHTSNPKHITQKILSDFLRIIRAQEKSY